MPNTCGACRGRRRTLRTESDWRELTRHGQIRPSYVPPRAILELRDLTRYRNKLLSAGKRTESSSESIGGCEYQTGFGLIGRIWRVWTKDATGVGEGRYGRYGQNRATGPLEPETQDRGYSARAAGEVNRSSPLPDRRLVAAHAFH